jgi:DNA topoisomerase-1
MPIKYTTTRKSLVIVESPAKCKKIESYLGPGYKCMASYGHLRELPSLQHIDVNNHFEPKYAIIDQPLKKKQIDLLKKEIASSDEVILACDNDREGEAICYHLCELFDLPVERTKRIIFNEITEPALQYAIQNPRLVNMNLVRAQQGRQILDVLVGFKISPVLWNYISKQSEKSLSAGRCQTPALKIIYENQMEINKHKEQKVYQTTGYFTNLNLPFTLNKIYEKEEEVTDFLFGSISFVHEYSCSKPEKTFKKPPEPFTTSSLQQKASNELHYSPKESMKLCQDLYEAGYITYMRTDSKTYCEEFVESTKSFICIHYDESYLNEKMDSLISNKTNLIQEEKNKPEQNQEQGTQSKTKKTPKTKSEKNAKNSLAQEAHEALRPTNLFLKELPETVTNPKERKMYKLIWENTLESCMASASYYVVHAKISAFEKTAFQYTSELIDFPGWKIVAKKYSTDNKEYQYLQTIKQEAVLPYKKMVSKVILKDIKMHYTEARLIQLLEENGIGRPSTYAMLVDKIQERGYVKKQDVQGKEIIAKDYELEQEEIFEVETKKTFGNEKNKLVIQPLGIIVMEFLENHFHELFDYNYTKQMEEELDSIAKGTKIWYELCEICYKQIEYCIEKLKETKQEQKLEIKIDDAHTYIIGKYGPVIKHTEIIDKKEVVQFKPIKKDIDFHELEKGSYKMEELVDTSVQKKERILGLHEGNQVILRKGKYGLYISWGENSKTLKELGNRPVESICFEEILKYLEEGSNNIRKITDNISIRKGAKGDYLFYKTPKMKKPQFFSLHAFDSDYKNCKIEILKNWISETYQIK